MMAILAVTYSQSTVYDAVMRSAALRESGSAGEAVILLDEILKSNSDYRLHIERGEANLMLDDLAGAERDFGAASSLKPASGAWGLARVFAARGDARGAVGMLGQNIGSEFRRGERQILADQYMARIDNSADWRRFWDTDRYSEGEKMLEEVGYLIQRGRSADAAVMIADGEGVLPQAAEVVYADAWVRYSLGDYQGAVNKLTAIGSGEMAPAKRDRLMADSYSGMGDYRKAVSLFSSLITSEYADAGLYYSRAEAYLGLSDYRRAIADIDYYISLYPGQSEALRLAGQIYIASGDNNGALKYFNRVIDVSPNSREAYVGRGDLWTATGMFSNAVMDYAMALDLDPADGDVYLSKGMALLKLGKTEEACFDFRMAIRNGNRRASEQFNRHCIK